MLQQISSGSVKTIFLNRDNLWRRLVIIARQIKTKYENLVQDVRVFGSIARGDHVGTSDVDVLIILTHPPSQDLPLTRLERARLFYPFFILPIGVDLLVYTTAELEQGTPFISHIYEESISLLP